MKTTIARKIITPIIALAVLLTVFFLSASLYIFHNHSIKTGEAVLRNAAQAAREHHDNKLALSGLCARRIAYDPDFVLLLQSGDRDAIQEFLQNVQEESGADFTAILDATGKTLIRSHSDIIGDDLSRSPAVKTALSGRATAGVVSGTWIRLAAAGSAPIHDAQGGMVGAVITGFRMDSPRYAEELKRMTNTEVTIFLGDARIATTIKYADGSRAVGIRLNKAVAGQVLAGKEFLGKTTIMGNRTLACYLPVYAGAQIPGVLCVSVFAAPHKLAPPGLPWESLLVACVALAMMIPVCIRAVNKAVAPVGHIAAVAKKAANGDLAVHVRTAATEDETELLGESLNQMIEIARQREALSDTLMALHGTDRRWALEIVLDRVGAYLDLSRIIFLKDRLGERTCEVEYEWRNKGFEPSLPPGRVLSYETDLPGLYGALRSCGNLLLDHGEISGPYRALHSDMGFTASAMFTVYCNGEQYGFLWFADSVTERRWDTGTARFLQNASNLVSAALEQRETAEKLMQNQTSYEAVLNNIDSYIFVADAVTDRIIFANQAFKSAFGEYCEGHPVERYLRWRDPEDTASASGENGGGQYAEIFCESSGKWLAVSSETITWLDGTEVRLVNCYDITAKKQFADTLEEKIRERTYELLLMTREAEKARTKAEEATRAKARFLANMSHEIRTPMNAVIGMAQIYRNSSDPERKEYCIGKIEESSTHLLGVINDILDMSKIEAGKMEIALAEFSFPKMLDRVGGVLNYSLTQKEQVYQVSIDAAVPQFIISDEQRMSQVLTNLLSNAAKFTPIKGRISLNANLVSETGKDCVIAVAVTDTGIGISEEEQGRLFHSFAQADAGISRKFGGTGLGLVISQNIARALGGDIVVASAPGKGSTFTATFRVQKGRENGTEEPLALTPDPEAGQAVSLAGYTVLLVEDVAINREIVISLLEPTEVAIECAESGAEAIRMFSRDPGRYHAILMDINMPEMDGYETTRRIRTLMAASGLSVPIIAMTAHAFREDIEKCLACGMDDHVSKPLDIDVVIAKLERHIARARQ